MNKPPLKPGSDTPRISVLMAVYNGERYLREAIDSILRQTRGDFEFVVVDDGSTDGTAAILDSCGDGRIVRLRNDRNLGLVAALNRGLEAARAAYVARMDADDAAEPDRLEQQARVLEAHPDVAVVGGQAILMDEGGRELRRTNLPTDPTVLGWRLQSVNQLVHPAVMFRRSVIVEAGGYRADFGACGQDYDLWLRVARRAGIAQLAAVVLRYRAHAAGISRTRAEEQEQTAAAVMRDNARVLYGLELGPEAARGIRALMGATMPGSPEVSRAAVALLVRLGEVFCVSRGLTPEGCATVRRDIASHLAAHALRSPGRDAGREALAEAMRADPLCAAEAVGDRLAKLESKLEGVRRRADALGLELAGIQASRLWKLALMGHALRDRLTRRGRKGQRGVQV